MPRTVALSLFALLISLVGPLGALGPLAPFAASRALAGEKTVKLAVSGMTCASCPYMVKSALKKVEGVREIDVSLEKKLAVVTFDDAKTDVAALTEATLAAGFPSEPIADEQGGQGTAATQ